MKFKNINPVERYFDKVAILVGGGGGGMVCLYRLLSGTKCRQRD